MGLEQTSQIKTSETNRAHPSKPTDQCLEEDESRTNVRTGINNIDYNSHKKNCGD